MIDVVTTLMEHALLATCKWGLILTPRGRREKTERGREGVDGRERDGGIEGGMEGGRKRRREGGREEGREGGERWREGGREGGREGRDGGRKCYILFSPYSDSLTSYRGNPYMVSSRPCDQP